MGMEEDGKPDEAGKLSLQAWNEATNDFEKYIAAYYVARHQDNVAENDLSVFSHEYASHEHLGIDIRLHNLLKAVGRRLSTGGVSQHCEDNRGKCPPKNVFRQSPHPAIVHADKPHGSE